jgi:hypothetical protein
VNVGARHGVCRDFAVLGYCERGLDCDKQHVRECPDFAEKGICSTKGCKLPHVIRANRNRKVAEASIQSAAEPPPPSRSSNQSQPNGGNISVSTDVSSFEEQQQQPLTAEDARLGDEYISLTFNESESSEEDSEDEEDDNDNRDEDSEEGSDPNEESEHQ